MARQRRSKQRVDTSDSGGAGGTLSLGDLLQQAGFAPSADDTPEPARPHAEDEPAGPLLAPCGELQVRRERKGRRGKEVTLVAGLEPLAARAREALARRLRKQLGCGASLEGPLLVLQGDQRERLARLLADEGGRPRVL